MKASRLVGALALLFSGAVAWAPAGASSTSSSDTGRLVLRGSVSMSSTGAAYVLPVFLPRQVTVTMDEDMHVEAARGRFPGFILRKDGPGLQQSASDFLAHGCLSKGCRPPHYPFFDTGGNEFPLVVGERATDATLRTGVLSPGRYHLFVVADGAPMHATLRLHGLSGQLPVHSGSALTASVSEPAPSVFSPPAGSPLPGQLYSAGSTHRMPSTSGFFFDMMYKVMPGDSVSEADPCAFGGPPAPNALGPYQYPCSTPTDPVEAGFDVLALQDVDGAAPIGTNGGPAGLIPEYVTARWYWGPFTAPGRVISLGGYIDSPNPAVSAHVLILWIDFTGDQLRGKPWKIDPPASGITGLAGQ